MVVGKAQECKADALLVERASSPFLCFSIWKETGWKPIPPRKEEPRRRCRALGLLLERTVEKTVFPAQPVEAWVQTQATHPTSEAKAWTSSDLVSIRRLGEAARWSKVQRHQDSGGRADWLRGIGRTERPQAERRKRPVAARCTHTERSAKQDMQIGHSKRSCQRSCEHDAQMVPRTEPWRWSYKNEILAIWRLVWRSSPIRSRFGSCRVRRLGNIS